MTMNLSFLPKLFAMTILLSVLTSCVAPLPTPIGTDTYYYGYINKGAKFGVKVGQTREEAKRVLTGKGFRYVGVIDCSDRGLQETIGCRAAEVSDAYVLRKLFRQGELYVLFSDEKVTSIAWSFYLLPSIDL